MKDFFTGKNKLIAAGVGAILVICIAIGIGIASLPSSGGKDIASNVTGHVIANDRVTSAYEEDVTAAIETEKATEAPTEEPTEAPTEEPTEAPTEAPTQAPTQTPSSNNSQIQVSATASKYVTAYKNNSTAGLNANEIELYKVAASVVNEAKKQGSAYYQEKYVHDWIVNNCQYDYTNYINGTLPNVSFTPYGVFVNHVAVCQGYADAFEICMGMLDIPCIGIVGSAGGVGHKWNAVCLDGEWYQVDVTWDDPVDPYNFTPMLSYEYFNITDAMMKKDHSYSSSVSCTGTKYSYTQVIASSTDPSVCRSKEEVISYVGNMFGQGNYDFEFTLVDVNGGAEAIMDSIDIGEIYYENFWSSSASMSLSTRMMKINACVIEVTVSAVYY